MVVTPRVHGGPDADGAAPFDFSTNTNACGPCPAALAAVRAADATRYPDAAYAALRARLARFHGVDAWRIVPAASGSEFIFRVSAWAVRAGLHRVALPRHGYGDYAAAASAHGLTQVPPEHADLVWACEPSSPLGQPHPELAACKEPVRPELVEGQFPSRASTGSARTVTPKQALVLDLAYEPLRLSGAPSLDAAQRDTVWQLWTPNKALGLTGVRGAYAIAPRDARDAAAQLEALAPSWVLGAHAAAMLEAWCAPQVQQWLVESKATLRQWKDMQVEMLQAMGWRCEASDANFFACEPGVDTAALLVRLRGQGIQLRDCTSFGLPGVLRLSVQPPEAQAALRSAWEAFR
ncbi:MAG: aminotransferase class I/II-fold pyridoxal phosphate-dependent enzyme [Pseudomonadota bacterium]